MSTASEFHWHGVDANGKKISGKIAVADEQEVRQKLTVHNITPLHIKRKSHLTLEFKATIRTDDIIDFSRNLATLINANLTLHQALCLLSTSHPKKNMTKLIADLAEQLNGGMLFSDVLQQYPQYFNTIYLSLIRCGEQSGQFALMLTEITHYLESAARLKKRLKKALSYPITMISITLIIAVMLLIFVIPQFKSLFDSYHAPLPKLTQAVLAIAQFIQQKWWYLIAGSALVIATIRKSYRQSNTIKTFIDKLLLRIPIYGNLTHKASLARILQTLAVNYAANVPLDQSLATSATLSKNSIVHNAIEAIRTDISHGITLANAFQNQSVFPPMLVQMIQVGEQTGALEELLKKLANIYQDEVDNIVNNVSSLIEPLMIVVLGSVIGCFVLAMYLPIFKLGSLF